jgi:hypothetical protein
VIRTSVSEDILDAAGTVTACKKLKHAEREFPDNQAPAIWACGLSAITLVTGSAAMC